METKNIIYPVTKELEELTSDMIGNKRSYTIEKLREIIIEVVQEYEHGTADVEDVEGVNIKQYSSVAHDLLMCIENHCEPGEDHES